MGAMVLPSLPAITRPIRLSTTGNRLTGQPASAAERSGELGLRGCGPSNRLRRWHVGQSTGEFECVRKLVEGKPVVVRAGARRRAGPGVRGLAGRVRQGTSSTWSLTICGAARTGGDSDHDPVNLQSADSVRVVENECSPQRRRPRQRWRDVGPWQVYCTGIGAPLANAGLVIVNGPPAGAAVIVRPTVVTFGERGAVFRLSVLALRPASTATSASPAPTNAIR